VLQVINTSPGNLVPVFEAMLDKAIHLCDATYGHFRTYDGEGFPLAAVCGDPSLVELHRQRFRYFAPGPHNPISGFRQGERLIHISDTAASEAYRDDPDWQNLVDTGACRSVLAVALRKDTALLGYISVYRQEVRPFSDKQIALLENFAAQAVIAMENARLLDEIRQRQEELRITFENMGDGVAMFDETERLIAWNCKFQEIFDLPDVLLEQHRTYEEHLRFLAARGDFGAGVDTTEQIDQLVASTGQPYGYERTRPDGRVIEIRRNPVPDGGFVLIFSDITERKRSEVEIRAARDAAEAALRDLKAAQANLIQAEKMASLGNSPPASRTRSRTR
jgi:two-component system NtrC family sensor kinase